MKLLPKNFSLKKMFKKAFKVGGSAVVTVSTIGLGTVGVNPTDATTQGLWTGLGAAILSCVVNFLSQAIKREVL